MIKIEIEKSNVLNTKFGRAKLQADGYYRITSSKEGNANKLLHRLIFQEVYGLIPQDFIIHHKNRDKTSNCVLNLQLMRKGEHHSLHTKGVNHKGKKNPFYNKKHSEASRKKMSEAHTKDYPRITKDGFLNGKQCYRIRYNGKRLKRSVDKRELEKIVNKINRGEKI